jgi:hypothetical protein
VRSPVCFHPTGPIGMKWRPQVLLEGVNMAGGQGKPRALFLFREDDPQPDRCVCSGEFPSHLGGEQCTYSESGRIPAPIPGASGEAIGEGDVPSLSEGVPPCIVLYLGRVSEWKGGWRLNCPPDLRSHALYKCKQMFLLILLSRESE